MSEHEIDALKKRIAELEKLDAEHRKAEDKRVQDNEQIRASLREKEILLGEIHHRVKNNLQIISSLLNLQARYIKDEKILNMFKESQSRINSMALIHERLYRSKDLVKINFPEYVRSLAAGLFSSYSVSSDDVTLEIDIKDVELDLDLAISCGLVLNELLSNALKYAFPNGRKGKIKVSLYEVNGNEVELVVGDNGIGLPEVFDFQKTESLGFQIIITLVEGQLEGKIELNKTEGTEFRIKFKKPPAKERI